MTGNKLLNTIKFVFKVIPISAFIGIVGMTGTATAQENSDCLACHSDEELVTENEKGEEVSLFVDESTFTETIHGEFSCIDCHTDLDGTDDGGHDVPLEKVNCATCHEDVDEIYNTSIHGQLKAMGDILVPDCASCHGKHNIFPASDNKSTVNKFNLMNTCASCHQNHELQESGIFNKPDALPLFYESVHAKALIKDGLIVAPSCSDCHGVHNIQNSSNPASPVYKRNVYKTCGQCHTKVEEVYETSIHGQLVESGDKRGPVCTNCHESHRIVSPDVLAFQQYSDNKCGQCHEDMLERYHETFHGKAMTLGSTKVAACYDCHGYHDIVRSDDPNSAIHENNKLETCRKCHEGANKNFSNYIAHGNHYDKENYPQLYYTFVGMTGLLVGVFVFFGLHTLLWIVRSVALYIRDSKTFREAKVKVLEDDLKFRRFEPIDRFLHVMMILSFITLVITGMPLKFFDTNWAGSLMKVLGGVESAGYLHRVAALLMVFIFVVHLFNLFQSVLSGLRESRDPKTGKLGFKNALTFLLGPDSVIPHPRDLTDFWAHQKWFFGKGPKPKFDRWTYWEKFDYFAVFWGVFIIGFSGLIMWIPNFFTSFLPGWIINISLIIHSDEALLAAGFIFTFHFFNVHFRIEKFPMDTVIFSGRISMEELKEERTGWLERLESKNKLDTIKARDDYENWRPIWKTFGFIAFFTGIFLAIAIFTAMIVRMLSA